VDKIEDEVLIFVFAAVDAQENATTITSSAYRGWRRHY
jgi:hypothetical protein